MRMASVAPATLPECKGEDLSLISFGHPLFRATIVHRANRFRVEIELSGYRFGAHLANSGRLSELLAPGMNCLVAAASRQARKTPYDLVAVEAESSLVCVDARMPNAAFRDLLLRASGGSVLARRLLGDLAAYSAFSSEVRAERSRFDFLLSAPAQPGCWIECKSVTLVQSGCARFPDAPSARGARHLEDLRRRVGIGERAAVVFVVQRGDATSFAPNTTGDPAFAAGLASAAAAGVRLIAYRCTVTTDGLEIAAEIPVHL